MSRKQRARDDLGIASSYFNLMVFFCVYRPLHESAEHVPKSTPRRLTGTVTIHVHCSIPSSHHKFVRRSHVTSLSLRYVLRNSVLTWPLHRWNHAQQCQGRSDLYSVFSISSAISAVPHPHCSTVPIHSVRKVGFSCVKCQ